MFLKSFCGLFKNIIPASFEETLTYIEQLNLIKNKLNETIEVVNGLVDGGGSGYILPPAKVDKLGGIKVGQNLSITEDGTLSADDQIQPPYQLPKASDSVLGGIKVGQNLSITEDGTLSAEDQSQPPYQLPIATSTTLGGFKVGQNLIMTSDGVLSATGGGGSQPPYQLPVASDSVLGGIKVGQNLSITEDGTLSADDQSPYQLPIATKTTLGGILSNPFSALEVSQNGLIMLRLGKGLKFDYDSSNNGMVTIDIDNESLQLSPEGVLSVKNGGGGTYVLPIATLTTLGGVKQTENDPVKIEEDGRVTLYTDGTLETNRPGFSLGVAVNPMKGLTISETSVGRGNGPIAVKLGAGLKFDDTGAITLDTEPAPVESLTESVKIEKTTSQDSSLTEKIQTSDQVNFTKF